MTTNEIMLAIIIVVIVFGIPLYLGGGFKGQENNNDTRRKRIAIARPMLQIAIWG